MKKLVGFNKCRLVLGSSVFNGICHPVACAFLPELEAVYHLEHLARHDLPADKLCSGLLTEALAFFAVFCLTPKLGGLSLAAIFFDRAIQLVKL